MANDELKHAGYLHDKAVQDIEEISKVFTPTEEMEEKWEKCHKNFVENELKKHFDVDAFLILALVDKMNIDLVPESNVDESITDIQCLFVSYMRNRTKENLELLLSTIRKMLSELYMTCDLDEKEIFKKHLETLQNITQPNII